MEENKRKMLVERKIEVHTYDVDFMQIVNNTVYVKWFENLRMAMMDELMPLAETMKDGNSPIIAETNIQYRHPVTFDSKPVGYAWMSDLQKSRWTIEFEIREGDKIYATGKQIGYLFNIEAKRPVRWPEEMVEKWNNM